MKTRELRRTDLAGLNEAPLVLAEKLTVSGEGSTAEYRRGQLLAPAELLWIASHGPDALHVIEIEPGEVHEDEAALRIARAVAGEGVEIRGPVLSQAKLVASQPGVLTVDAALLARVNAVGAVCVFTLYDGQVIGGGRQVAGAKVAPLAVPEATLTAVETLCAEAGPVIAVRRFRPLRVAVLNRESLDPGRGARYEEHVSRRVRALGGTAVSRGFERALDASEIAAFIRKEAPGLNLVIVAGTNSVDPLDSGVRGLLAAGGALTRQGLPAHPGSTYWFGECMGIPVIGIGSCGMLSEATAFDLLLPRYFAGLPVDPAFIASLGHGGLLTPQMRFRFPRYGVAEDGSTEDSIGKD